VSANANGDISTPPDGTYETITLEEIATIDRRRRADVEVRPATSARQTVDSSECWGTTFAGELLHRRRELAADERDVAACVFRTRLSSRATRGSRE